MRFEIQDAKRLHIESVEGYNPSWAEPVIKRHYSHRRLSDRPTLRLSLHGLRQSLDDLKDPSGQDFAEALDWVNHADCPMSFSWVCAILEISPCDARTVICVIHPGAFTTAGALDLLRLRSATPAATLTAKQRIAEIRLLRTSRLRRSNAKRQPRQKHSPEGWNGPYTPPGPASWQSPQAQGACSRQAGRSSASSPTPNNA